MPFDCDTTIQWIVNQKIEYMSQKQLRQIQLALLQTNNTNGEHYNNGNASKFLGERLIFLNIMKILKRMEMMYKIFYYIFIIKLI